MKFEPRNRHILVEKIEKGEEDETKVLLPAGYKKVEEYTHVRVLAMSPDCSVVARKGEKIVVPTHLIQAFQSSSKIIYAEYYITNDYDLC